MSIIQKFSNMIYSRSKVRYERDETRDENDLSERRIGKETQKTYFHFDDKNNKIANVLVRIGNRIAHFFGAKTISQNNLSNCLRHANSYFTDKNEIKYKFTVSQLLEAKSTLSEIKSSEKFGGYLESNKGVNDKDRIDSLEKHLNNELISQKKQLLKLLGPSGNSLPPTEDNEFIKFVVSKSEQIIENDLYLKTHIAQAKEIKQAIPQNLTYKDCIDFAGNSGSFNPEWEKNLVKITDENLALKKDLSKKEYKIYNTTNEEEHILVYADSNGDFRGDPLLNSIDHFFYGENTNKESKTLKDFLSQSVEMKKTPQYNSLLNGYKETFKFKGKEYLFDSFKNALDQI